MRYGFLEKDKSGNTMILKPKISQKLTLSVGIRPIFVLYGFRDSILKWFRKYGHVHIELKTGASNANAPNKLTFDFQRIGKFTLTPWRCVIRGTVDQDYDRFDDKSNLPKRDLPIILKTGISFSEAADSIENQWNLLKNSYFNSSLNTPNVISKVYNFSGDPSSLTIPARRSNRYSLQSSSINCSSNSALAPPPYTTYSNSRQSFSDSQELPTYNSTRVHCRADIETLSVLIEQYSRRL
ncbi:hypothetical protein K7432_008428 [Basidiobolus ranarum]|uniref:Uncharacterized protein n=1 Tax=Basidiobolus ranarum TaxID=34480 RepID=A0ABR2WRY7_9FUNG